MTTDDISTRTAHIKLAIQRGDFETALNEIEALKQHGELPQELAKLEVLAKRRKELLTKHSAQDVKLQKLSCAGCGSGLSLHHQETVSFGCPHCGVVTDTARGVTIAQQRMIPPLGLLSLGLTGEINGVKGELIGRIHYSGTIQEWDSEDSVYERNHWAWDEWSILTEKGEIWYLAEDSEGFVLFTPFTPRSPEITPDSSTGKIHDSILSNYRIAERGTVSLSYKEGELSWIPQPSETLRYAEYSNLGTTYSAEWRIVDDKAVEVEFYKGNELSDLTVFEAFNCTEGLKILYERRKKQFEGYAWASAFILVAVMLLVGAAPEWSKKPRTIFSTGDKSLREISPQGDTYGPFNLTKKGVVHSIALNASIPDNSNAWVGVELLDSEQNTINAADGDFWRESGYDDGAWSESELNSEGLFVLENPGVYFVRLSREDPPMSSVNGTTTVRILENVGVSRYHIVASIISGIIGIFFAVAGMSLNSKILRS
jgi:hypothetical protein